MVYITECKAWFSKLAIGSTVVLLDILKRYFEIKYDGFTNVITGILTN